LVKKYDGGVAERVIDGRESRGAETRQRIVEAVWSVIAERGLAGLTTRRVAERAGISHGMCHYHFETKDEMVLGVVEYARHYWIIPLEELVDTPMPPEERLERLIRWMAEPATREVMRVHLQLVSQSEYNDRLRERMAEEYARWQAGYVRVFRELEQVGLLMPGADAEALAVGFATLADGLVDQQSLNPKVHSEGVMRAFLAPIMRSSSDADPRVPSTAIDGG
jgi:AcrR family transcriptional regulator